MLVGIHGIYDTLTSISINEGNMLELMGYLELMRYIYIYIYIYMHTHNVWIWLFFGQEHGVLPTPPRFPRPGSQHARRGRSQAAHAALRLRAPGVHRRSAGGGDVKKRAGLEMFSGYIIFYVVVWNIFLFSIWDNPPHWLICFKMVKATNQ